MTLTDLLQVLKSKEAFIVHCVRSNRGGELNPKPLYPKDLEQTIIDLTTGNARPVSCSVVWPTHQEAYGEIGIIVKPRSVDEIMRLCTIDGGTLITREGSGEPLSSAAVDRTFTDSIGHNEWLLTGGDVVGIFLNFAKGLYVAQLMDAPPGMSVEEAKELGIPPGPYPVEITVPDIAASFPGLRMFGFVGGVLMEIDPNGEPVAACHPY